MSSSVLTTWCVVVVVAFAHFNVLSAHGGHDGGDSHNNYGVCPRRRVGVVGPCVERCSSDRDCPPGTKCCSNGCGHVCTKAYIEKPGVCPRRHGPVGTCPVTCWDDSACPGGQKCCYNGCGHVCMNP